MAETTCGRICALNPFDHDPRGDRIYIVHSLQCWCGVHTDCANSRCRCICHSDCYGCNRVEELSREKPQKGKRK